MKSKHGSFNDKMVFNMFKNVLLQKTSRFKLSSVRKTLQFKLNDVPPKK